MSNIQKLIEDSVGAYLVGKKIASHELQATKDELSEQLSESLSAILMPIGIAVCGLIFLIFASLSLGSVLSTITENRIFLYLTPALSFGLITSLLYMYSRNK